MHYKIIYKKPVLWPLINLFFPNARWGEICLTFGKTIYADSKLPANIIAHELVHVGQQRNIFIGTLWWILYCLSTRFRLSQEIPAHRAQFNYNPSKKNLIWAATALSGKVYGNMITYGKAVELITNATS